MIEYVDSKNGVDFLVIEDFLTFIVYGQTYSKNGKYNFTQCSIQIQPYDENRDYISFILMETRYERSK